jgi:hypothetical protein
MSILIAYLESSQKTESDEYNSLTCGETLFLSMSILKRVTFGSDLLVIPNTFGVFLFFRARLLFLACLYLAG